MGNVVVRMVKYSKFCVYSTSNQPIIKQYVFIFFCSDPLLSFQNEKEPGLGFSSAGVFQHQSDTTRCCLLQSLPVCSLCPTPVWISLCLCKGKCTLSIHITCSVSHPCPVRLPATHFTEAHSYRYHKLLRYHSVTAPYPCDHRHDNNITIRYQLILYIYQFLD